MMMDCPINGLNVNRRRHIASQTCFQDCLKKYFIATLRRRKNIVMMCNVHLQPWFNKYDLAQIKEPKSTSNSTEAEESSNLKDGKALGTRNNSIRN